mgnify:CR=1 FL=1
MTYHVLTTGVTVLVIYLFSLYLASSGFTPGQSHRRFWNWILLLSFLVAAIPGLFLALRITYRWEVSFAGPLLQWHVEAGIAMAFAAIIHLSWHMAYYFRRSRIRENEVAPHTTPPVPGVSAAGMPALRLRPLLLLTGFVSSASQFILIREAAILGGGTETMTGLFLWLWLIIAAGGAATGSRSVITSMRRMVWTLLAGTVLAPVCFLMMNRIVLSPGETPTFFQALVILAVTVAPVTFISALIFVRISVLRNAAGVVRTGTSFAAETAGSVAAGLATALAVTIRIPNYLLYMIILASAVACAVWFLGYSGRIKMAVTTVMLILGLLMFIFPPDKAVRSLLMPGVRAGNSIDTPFGNITTGIYSDVYTVFYDHRPVFSPGDVISAEGNSQKLWNGDLRGFGRIYSVRAPINLDGIKTDADSQLLFSILQKGDIGLNRLFDTEKTKLSFMIPHGRLKISKDSGFKGFAYLQGEHASESRQSFLPDPALKKRRSMVVISGQTMLWQHGR